MAYNQNLKEKITSDFNKEDIFLNIIFRYQGKSISILCQFDERVDNIIRKFRYKINFTEEALFTYNVKQVDQSLTLAKSGLVNQSIIFVLPTSHIKGSK